MIDRLVCGEHEVARRAYGSGSLQLLPSGRFRVRLRMSDGTRRSTTIDASSRDEAARICDAMVTQLADERLASVGSPTLRGLGERWLCSRTTSRATTEHARQIWRTHVLDPDVAWADVAVADITAADCAQWIERLAHKRARQPGAWTKGGHARCFDRTLSHQTRVHCRNVLRAFFSWCVEQGFVRDSPATRLVVRLADQDRTREDAWTFLTVGEIERLRACELVPEELRDLFVFAVFSGMRQGELWALRWSDVVLDAPARVSVRRSHDRGTKSGRVRHFPLFAPALEALVRQHARSGSAAHGLVWPDHHGEQRAEKTDAGWADRSGAGGVRLAGWKTVAGIARRVRFHDLRHTCASHLLMGSWGRAWALHEVQRFLGHSDISVTLRYAHLSSEHLYAAAAATRG